MNTDNCVIYIINPYPHAAALADICTSFWHLFQQLVADAGRRQARQVNEIVLQIVPIDFIMLGDSMFVPTQSDYLNLALEVYNRCRPLDPQASPLLCASAIQLAETVPKSINFRLAADKGSPLEDGRSLHIACSKSSDQRWLSVAWSDGKGALQTSVSYCLRHRTRGAARMNSEIRNEIWVTTKYFLDKSPTRWKVVLVTTEPADADDLEGKRHVTIKTKFKHSLICTSVGRMGRTTEQASAGHPGVDDSRRQHHPRPGIRASYDPNDHKRFKFSIFIHSRYNTQSDCQCRFT